MMRFTSEISLDNTVDFYFSIFKRKNLFRLFNGLEKDLLDQYKKLKIDNLNSDINLIQEFFLNIGTGIKGEGYDISWSIPKAIKLINERNIDASDIMIDNLYYDFSNLEYEKLNHYKNIDVENFEPIIISFYLPTKELVVIDGTHRLYHAFSRGNKVIKAYVLSSYANSLIMNDRNYKLYSFHHNLVNLLELCCNPYSWKFSTNNSLKWDTYNGGFIFSNVIMKKIFLLSKRPVSFRPIK
ncbi:hypothetical protein [Elizabethkingia anophelis]|uniref:hypothetical protein n=1 Tax=Elizabethkingia anophelis TaxID=1117645 RepID=UPI0024E21450|nr:hypothetical protein [Elizabethkingia anophelis]CAH1136492.1 hypothetical protein EAVVTKC53_03403 [Elizabethkingia anophelis]CAI9682495.1 hypothetical protein EAVVTKC53_02035 [Elizabethkingia anophelis]